MISDSQFYVVDIGKTVTMECSFHADRYRLFDTPVMWRKQQLNDNLPINMLSSINEPFVATGRFSVEFTATEPRYQLPLSISGMARNPLVAICEVIASTLGRVAIKCVEWVTVCGQVNHLGV